MRTASTFTKRVIRPVEKVGRTSTLVLHHVLQLVVLRLTRAQDRVAKGRVVNGVKGRV